MSSLHENNTDRKQQNQGQKRKSRKLPALHFYPGDWKRETALQILPPLTRYVWFEMLLLMHDSERRGALVVNGRAMTAKEIAESIRIDVRTVEKAIRSLIDNGVASMLEDDIIVNRRMIEGEELSEVRASAGAKGGKQKRSKTKAKPKQNPEDEDEDEDEDVIEVKNKKKVSIPPELSEPGTQAALRDWAVFRKEIGHPLTGSMAEGIFKEYLTRPDELVRDIRYSIKNGYQGLFAPSTNGKPPGGPSVDPRINTILKSVKNPEAA